MQAIETQNDTGTTTEAAELETYSGFTATYSPEDNKLRLYSRSRLDADLYARVKEAGFHWAPKQELFVAPMWTPQRADLLIELCGEIGDEDTSLVDRAAERADRFEDYSDRRSQDADAAHRAVSAVSQRFEFGQPILIGHHSERKARKDAERMENGMRRAVKMWETSTYWAARAAGALQNAKYKELPGVRHRRIKGLEADKRKQERTMAEAQEFLGQWEREGLTLARAKAITNYSYISRCFLLADFPRDPPASQYEGSMGLWSALDGGIINEQQARDIAAPAHARAIAWAARWVEHYSNRIAYERAMLDESGGLKAEAFDIQPGGQVLIGGEWVVVLRVNKSGGQICSVTTTARYVRVRGIEEIKDYRAPSEDDAAKVKAVAKLPPMVNFPGEGFIEMTAEEWKRKSPDYKGTRKIAANEQHGAYRYKSSFIAGGSYRSAQVYITDAKRVERPAAPAVAVAPVVFVRELEAPTPSGVTDTSTEVPKQADKDEAFQALRDQLKAGIKIVVAPQLFPTPADVAALMAEKADIQPGDDVLEPEAGTGRIVQAVADAVGLESVQLTTVEINRDLSALLGETFPVARNVRADFLQCGDELGKFDVILMNPPFVGALDIAHILHAVAMLKPGGRIVAICANGPRQSDKLRPLVRQHGGTWEVLPAGTFKESGTGVNSVLLSFTV